MIVNITRKFATVMYYCDPCVFICNIFVGQLEVTVVHKGYTANKNIAANILKFVQMCYKFLQIH